MLGKIRSAAFILDQAVMSILSFVFFIGIASISNAGSVGALALVQSVALIGMLIGRAVGLDVWSSLGATEHLRAQATKSSLMPVTTALILSACSFFALLSLPIEVRIYLLSVPFVLLLDVTRVLLLHRGRAWISLAANSLTLLGVVLALVMTRDLVIVVVTYVVSVAITSLVCFYFTKVRAFWPSPAFFRANQKRSLSFLTEVGIGGILQQLLLLLLAVMSSVEIVGLIRIAQTLIGPLGVIHNGLAPIFLRKLGSHARTGDEGIIAKLGLRYGIATALVSLTGVFCIFALMSLQPNGVDLADRLLHQQSSSLFPVVLVLGVGLALNGISLGTGVACRTLGITGRLNRFRAVMVPFQIGILVWFADSTEVFIVTAALIFANLTTAVSSVIVLNAYSQPSGLASQEKVRMSTGTPDR